MSTVEERTAARRLLSDDERERLRHFDEIEIAMWQAHAQGKTSVTWELHPRAWIALIQEVRDRHPRNLSFLMNARLIDDANDLLDRMHEEINFMIAYGPAQSVAERYSSVRVRPPRTIPVSDELRKSNEGKGEKR